MQKSERLKPAQAATYLGFSPRTLAKWRVEGKGPHYLKIASGVRYDRAELDRFLTECRRTSTSATETPDAA